MARSIAAILLLLFLPSSALAQVLDAGQETSHEVVRGETLWELAGRYLGNPYRWPLIHEANADRVQNPHLIFPGQVLVIPGIGGELAQVRVVSVVTPGETPAEQAQVPVPEEGVAPPPQATWVQAPVGGSDACPGPEGRTVFYQGGADRQDCGPSGPPGGQRTSFYAPPATGLGEGESGGALGLTGDPALTEARNPFAVPMGFVYSAEWLQSPGVANEPLGVLEGLNSVHVRRTPRGPARIGERVLISVDPGVDLRVGDLLQSYRTLERDRHLGTTFRPTGIMVVSGREDDGVVAMVSSEYDRIQLGDQVRHAPEFTLQRGELPVPVESNVTGTILGFSEERSVQGFGARAFLDVGQAEGIAIGDVFVAVVDEPGPGFGTEAARMQVVSVAGDRCTVRITALSHPGFDSGDAVRLVAKMQ